MGTSRIPPAGPAVSPRPRPTPTDDHGARAQTSPRAIASAESDRLVRAKTTSGVAATAAQPTLPRLPQVTQPSAPRADAPPPIEDPEALIRAMSHGRVGVRTPLTAMSIGMVEIHPDTYTQTNLVIVNGRLDFEQSEILFVNGNGDRTELDGPLWWDPQRMYIDADGCFRADVPCFPDPNVTETILGEGHDQIPDSVTELMRLMGEQMARPPGDGMMDAMRAAAQPHNSQFSFDGTLAAGPISLGNGSVLDLDEGTSVTATGNLEHLEVEMHARVARTSLSAEGYHLGTGRGEVDLRFALDTGVTPEPGMDLMAIDPTLTSGFELSVDRLNVEGLEVVAPTPQGAHRLEIGRIDISAPASGEPLVHWRAATDDGPEAMRVNLLDAPLQDVRGELRLTGVDGAPSYLRLGRGSAPGITEPLNFRAAVNLDTAEGDFELNAEVDNLSGRLGPLELVDTDAFNVDLAGATMSGSGTISVSQTAGGEASLSLQAREGSPFTLSADIADARLGADAAGTQVVADVAAGSGGTLSLQRLDLIPGEHPVVQATASLDVTLDEIRATLPGGDPLVLSPGTHATLELTELDWRHEDQYPRAAAVLVVDLPPTLSADASRLEGLEGVEVHVDVATGQSQLRIQASLQPDGTLETVAGLVLRGAQVSGQIESNRTAPATPQIEPLSGALERFRQSSVRRLTPQTPALSQSPAALPLQPPVRFSVDQLMSNLDSPDISATVPYDRFSEVLFEHDSRERGWIDDTGVLVRARLNRPAGELRVNLQTTGAQIDANNSSVILDPPLGISVYGEMWWPGPLETATDAGLLIEGLEIRRDMFGRGYFHPRFRWVGTIPDALPDWVMRDIEERTAAEISEAMGESLMGSHFFSLNATDARHNMRRHLPVLSQDIVVRPGIEGSTQPGQIIDAPALPEMPEALEGLAARFSAGFDADAAQFAVSTGIAAPGRIELGQGQFIDFGPDSALSVSGTPGDLTIRGRVSLDGLNLGSETSGVSLGQGRAEFFAHIVAGPPARIEVRVDQLDTDRLRVAGAASGVQSELEIGAITNGQFSFSMGPDGTNVGVNIAHAEASVSGRGLASQGGQTASINEFSASFAGGIHIEDNVVTVQADRAQIDFSGAAAEGQVDNLSLSGAGTLRMVPGQSISLTQTPGARGLEARANIRGADGSRIETAGLSIESFSVGLGGTPNVSLTGISGEASLLAPIPGQPGAVLDLRRAQLAGSLRFGDDGFETIGGPLTISDVDGSVTQVVAPIGEGQRIAFRQIDLSGDAAIDASGGNFSVTSAAGMTARATLDDLVFRVPAPNVSVDLASGAQIEFTLHELALAGNRTRLHLQNGRLAGEIESGQAQIPLVNGASADVTIEPGARFSLELPQLLVRGRKGRTPEELELDATLRLESSVSVQADDVAPQEGIVIEEGRAGTQLNLAVRATADGPSNFAASFRAAGDLDLQTTTRARVDALPIPETVNN